MPSHQRILRLVGFALTLALLPLLVLSAPWIGALMGFAIVGGAFVALAQYWANRHGHSWGTSGDAVFARRRPATDVINMNSIKVAGLGGLGLVILSAVVALNFRLTAVALLLGLSGGAVGALLAILYRRRHGPIGSSSQGPGARVMLEGAEQPHDQPTGLHLWRRRLPRPA
jgi:hypothetical protein